ncbi:amino acid ABC transporter substrate-binding protein, PAAT family [Tistlia consotensis]|uniref:Amino acid ABC transporter substrate-binding protein, PAAT family n=1 Tax=Tistlia consotensis USBA 355 TaxID=560819 RepID=A0A1Y6CPW1_9PROT|nr:transporter substrate-binding domain-containing protein [Tistlia consotensis]SMF82375.1 amino acid ABC transporter substrate-binding protein, PAAT family [Tistlia consotensis USBA 355]SNS27439.1 amino acid ABC transporter substrate-binding protein, PAAT family [Tistlia consotensis]
MIWRLAAAALAALLGLCLYATDLAARPLDQIRERGRLLLCANPNALPWSARNGERHGIQVELADALARQLGVGLEVGWVVLSYHVARVDCDLVLDSIVDPEVQRERRVKLSRPYQRGGVVLAFRPGLPPLAGEAELTPALRIGAMVGSYVRLRLGQRRIGTIPYTFEDELIEALGRGELDVAAVSPASVGFYNLGHPEAPVTAVAAFAGVPELNWTVAAGLRKADAALVESVDRALDRLIADGTLQRIYAAYGVALTVPER